jgi:UDP-glucose 4-epimerase
MVAGIDKDESVEAKKRIADCVDERYMVWDDIKEIGGYVYATEDVDTIYHLSAACDIKRSLSDPGWDLTENVIRTYDVLDFMRRQDIDKLVFASTSVVHGENSIQPTPELGIDFNPISMYAASKISAESFIHAYCNVYGMYAWIFRFANVVGPNIHRGVIYDFINKLKMDKNKLKILGDGRQIKSFIHVSDCVKGMIDIPRVDGNKGVEIYNLASFDQKNITEVADIVCDEMGVKPEYCYSGGDRGWIGDVPRVVLSIDKALGVGWRPVYDSEEAIRLTVRAILENEKV